MGEYVKQFMEQSTKLTQYVRNQLEKVGIWTNVPGGLEKIAVSPAGYIWGYNSEFNVYSCKEPCNGNWTMHTPIVQAGDRSFIKLTRVLADNTHVYFMRVISDGRRFIAKKAVDGSGEWSWIEAPSVEPSSRDMDASLEMTEKFLFLGSKACAKPCATNSWVANDRVQNAKASSSGHLYAAKTDAEGHEILQQTDASAQGAWEDLDGLKDFTPLSADGDNTAIYGLDKTGRPMRCTPPYDKGDSCKPLDTGGRKPTSMSVNPTNNMLYMTTVEPGPGGNIFQRLDSDNTANVLDYSDKAVKELDRDVNSLGGEIRMQNAEILAGNTLKEASNVIREATNLHGPIETTQQDSQKLRRQILGSSQDSAAYTNSLLPLQILAGTLLGLFVVFAVVGFVLPTTITTGIAVLILAGGFGAAIYFVVKKQ
jgi:hypothetical protein